MAFDKNSNGFTFIFSGIMVIVVGAILASAAYGLKDLQQENLKKKKMKDILNSIGISDITRDEAPDVFSEKVMQRIILDGNGNVVETLTKDDPITPGNKKDAFNIDVQKDYKTYVKPLLSKYKGDAEGLLEAIKQEEKLQFPLFVCEDKGETLYVIPMEGTGLWGPIWGFISLKSDFSTVFGAAFDHKTETPGLGAEIKTPIFTKQFPGKEIFKGSVSMENFTSLKVLKGGKGAGDPHGVDGITGGTITSDGVGEMMDRTLSIYLPYFEQNQATSK